MIRSKWSITYDLIVLADDCFCTNLCILKTAHVSHLIVFEAFDSLMTEILIFDSWSIIWDRQCSSLWCQVYEVIFIMIFLLNWIEFVILSDTRLNFSNWISYLFWISHICLLVFIWINVLVYESRSNFWLASLLWDINVIVLVDI